MQGTKKEKKPTTTQKLKYLNEQFLGHSEILAQTNYALAELRLEIRALKNENMKFTVIIDQMVSILGIGDELEQKVTAVYEKIKEENEKQKEENESTNPLDGSGQANSSANSEAQAEDV